MTEFLIYIGVFLVGTFFGKYILGAADRLAAAEFAKLKTKL